MLFIHDTVSLCSHCYRHIPAFVFERDGQIYMRKKCSLHGESEHLIEPDAELFYSLKFSYKGGDSLLFEITDKCQLECPHCYHLPDNKTKDKSIDNIISQIQSFPNNVAITLAGAEPTLHPDFFKIINEIKNSNHFIPNIRQVLTNGVKFSSKKFVQQSVDAGLTTILFGLNHVSYNGENTHKQQLTALSNCIDEGLKIGYVGYTLESLDHIPDVLDEIQRINHPSINQFRIRCGSFIGRSSDQHRSYISNTLQKIEEYIGKENYTILDDTDNNIYHINILWKNAVIRVIQWPDVENINMEELNMGPYCQFYGKPITNFVHQVIIRDIYKNMKFPLYDGVPSRYTYYNPRVYWRSGFAEKQYISEYNYKNNLLLSNRVSQF